MAEEEIALMRVLRVFFVRLLVKVWTSLDSGTKIDVMIVAAVAIAIGLSAYIYQKLPERHSYMSRLRHRKARVINQDTPRVPITSLMSYWIVLNVELRVGGVLCTVLLSLAALGSWPYNFYILMRIVVCISFSWFAVILHRDRLHIWEIGFAGWALLFNPIAPFHFPRDTWQLFNLLALFTLVPFTCFYAERQVALLCEKKTLPVDAVASVSPTEQTEKSRKYRYCESCSVRVGLSDTFCKRCGAALT